MTATTKQPHARLDWKQTEDGAAWYCDFYSIQCARIGLLERKVWTLKYAGEKLGTPHRFLFQAKSAAYLHRRRLEGR